MPQDSYGKDAKLAGLAYFPQLFLGPCLAVFGRLGSALLAPGGSLWGPLGAGSGACLGPRRHSVLSRGLGAGLLGGVAAVAWEAGGAFPGLSPHACTTHTLGSYFVEQTFLLR